VSPSLKVYSARQLIARDVAVLFLLDLSASTATRLHTGAEVEASSSGKAEGPRVIDLIKEAVVLLSVALEEIGDAYAIYGFSSSGRHDVEVYPVKNFKESLAAEAQGRIGALTPRGSTRMGAAVRHAIRRLKGVSSRSRLLVVLSDGYPEDEDYGKPVIPPMYGLRDTLVALREAERSGITSFFLTVDKGGHDYLREMCPSSRYMVIEDVHSLPTELPKIYQRHIWSQWV
jgi:nitric oxide reductase NorD protein